MKTLNQFISDNRLSDLTLLKEFLSRGAKGPALQVCNAEIATYEKKISALKELKKLIEEGEEK